MAASLAIGERPITPGWGWSTPSVIAGGPSMMRFTHRIWMARERHRAAPNSAAPRMVLMAPMLVRQLEAHELRRCCRRWRGLRSTALTMVAKLSSVSTMSAASLVTSVPVMPMATPMSAGAAPRRVVHAVAGHGHDVAPRLERLDDPDLVLGRHPGDTPMSSIRSSELVVVHRVELGAGDDSPVEPELVADGAGGGGVVAGDHLHGDAGRRQQGDGVGGLGAWRVDDADEHQRRSARSAQRRGSCPGLGVEHGRAGPRVPRPSTRRPCAARRSFVGLERSDRRSSSGRAHRRGR